MDSTGQGRAGQGKLLATKPCTSLSRSAPIPLPTLLLQALTNTDTLPHRRLVDKPGAIAQCFELGPVSCECHRQCLRLQCGLLNEGSGKCALQRYTEPACWEWPDRPPHLQLSAVPHENDTSVVGHCCRLCLGRCVVLWQSECGAAPG